MFLLARISVKQTKTKIVAKIATYLDGLLGDQIKMQNALAAVVVVRAIQTKNNFNRNTTFESNGPEGRIRGNAQQLFENTHRLRMMHNHLAIVFCLKPIANLLIIIIGFISPSWPMLSSVVKMMNVPIRKSRPQNLSQVMRNQRQQPRLIRDCVRRDKIG